MMDMKNRLPHAVILLSIFLIILARFHLTLVRYFDPDEFAHMHWAWLITHGHLPYRDFFFYVTPFYQWFLAPVFLFLPEGPVTVLIARFYGLGLYLGTSYLLYRITRMITGDGVTALLSVLIFMAFPMTLDKTIDIRPDMLMVSIYLGALFLILKPGVWKRRDAFITGTLLGTGILTLPKILFALPAAGYLLFAGSKKFHPRLLPHIIAGGILPAAVLSAYLAVNGLFSKAVSSMTGDAFLVNAGKTPFSPWKALSPWPLVYMERGGPSYPWFVNSALWVLAVFGLIALFIKKPKFGLFFLLFYTAGILFVFSFPAPYLQYFLPLSVFASSLAAYTLILIIRMIPSPARNAATAAIIIVASGVLLSSFYTQYRIRASDGYSNGEQLGVIRDIVQIARHDEPVYDMVGSFVFRPDGYYFCCHPYGEFVDRLGVQYPTLRASLADSETKFLILDRTGMSLWQPKPDDLLFLESHFIPSGFPKIYVPGAVFSCAGGACTRLDVHGRKTADNSGTIDIVIPETYRVEITPPSYEVEIDGIRTSNNSEMALEKNTHRVSVPREVITVKIMLTH